MNNSDDKDREKERINNLKITIKQLGDQVTKDELVISELKEKVKQLESTKTGLELQLASYNDRIKKLREDKVINVVEYSELENITANFTKAIVDINKTIANNKVNNQYYSRQDINNIEDLQYKVNDLKDQLYEQSIVLDKKQLELQKKENEINIIESELKAFKNLEQDIELAKHMLSEKDAKISELVDECNKWSIYLEQIEKKYNLGIIGLIASNIVFIILMIMKG